MRTKLLALAQRRLGTTLVIYVLFADKFEGFIFKTLENPYLTSESVLESAAPW